MCVLTLPEQLPRILASLQPMPDARLHLQKLTLELCISVSQSCLGPTYLQTISDYEKGNQAGYRQVGKYQQSLDIPYMAELPLSYILSVPTCSDMLEIKLADLPPTSCALLGYLSALT